MNAVKPLFAALLAAGAALAQPWALAHAADGEETATPVLVQKLLDVPGKQVILVVVSYEPGQASAAHVHPGSVFAYVLEGEVESQLEGQTPVTYRAGQSWYEPPRIGHLVSRNASTTRPAKLLAWLLVGEGAKAKEPLPK